MSSLSKGGGGQASKKQHLKQNVWIRMILV
jgi:hypothetical protein